MPSIRGRTGRPELLSPAVVYLLHFSQPYHGRVGCKGPVQHRLSVNVLPLPAFLEAWRLSQGPRPSADCGLMDAVDLAQIDYQLVRVWPLPTGYGAYRLMRQFKRSMNYSRLCPLCVEKARRARRQEQQRRAERLLAALLRAMLEVWARGMACSTMWARK